MALKTIEKTNRDAIALIQFCAFLAPDAIPEDEWVVSHDLTPVELADVLVRLAPSVSLPKLRKHPRGPKKPKPKKQSGAEIKHVATAKILEARHRCTK